MEPGESAPEACEREILEETGLRATVERLIAVYSSPDRKIVYPDGNEFQFVSMMYEVSVEAGEVLLDHESTEWEYFYEAEIAEIDLMKKQRERISDIFAQQEAAFCR